ncbi:beta-lactamase-like protein [Achaetomium macrosporum]|uniref:Beta-lactamase-like protein n=1 Tax=Achaetomium macrosporum TaxID=79813 RepID=A0AAN7CGY3_9PEZI|nr:beta-lactamase-like protein [Achaetomium macrosporum]
MSSPTFATPLPQSPRSHVLEWRFPKPYHNLTLTGRSRAAWHTSFIVPQLNLLLDAGLCINKMRPKHIFLTHGHSDHTLLTPAYIKRSDPPDIFCPAEMKEALDGYLNAKTMLNEGGGIWPPESKSPYHEYEDDDQSDDDDSDPPREGGGEDVELAGLDAKGEGQSNSTEKTHPLLRTHTTQGLRPGETVTLRRLPPQQPYTATAFACDHTVPCLGYLFSAVTHKLRPEFRGLKGPALRALREEQGVEITAPVATPVFAFLGDTTAATLAAGPEWLERGVPVVITECSFLYEEHRRQAERTGHTIWADLEPVVRRWPGTVFVLMHFSMRYSDEEIRRFFRERDVPRNVVVWIDGGDEGGGGDGGR